MPRKYEVRVCEGCGARCEWRVGTYVPCPRCGAIKPDGQRMQGETVTAVDLRDVEPLVEAVRLARRLLLNGRWGDAHFRLIAALKAFEEDSE